MNNIFLPYDYVYNIPYNIPYNIIYTEPSTTSNSSSSTSDSSPIWFWDPILYPTNLVYVYNTINNQPIVNIETKNVELVDLEPLIKSYNKIMSKIIDNINNVKDAYNILTNPHMPNEEFAISEIGIEFTFNPIILDNYKFLPSEDVDRIITKLHTKIIETINAYNNTFEYTNYFDDFIKQYEKIYKIKD